MSKKDLIWKIEHGDDSMFDVGNRHFTILTWPVEGIVIGEQFPNDGHDETFPTAEELLDGFTIDGIPLAELVHIVKITDYTQVIE